jgi:hypothetical protein
MTTNNFQVSPFLTSQRKFPYENISDLALQSDLAYIDVAQKVNLRTIGIFPTNYPVLTGETWFINGQNLRQQTLRQVYTFTATGNIPHGINFASVSAFTAPFGSFTDGTNYYGAIYASNVAIVGQVSFYVTPTNIVVIAGAGAPAIVSGIIVLQWLSNF